MQRWSDGFTNAFLLVYALDAALSLLEETLRASTGLTLLLPLRNAVALPVFYVSFLAIPILAVNARLPARLLMPLFVSAVWLNNGAAPLALFLPSSAVGPVATGLQAGFAALAYRYVRLRHGTWIWSAPPETPSFSMGHWGRTTAFIAFGLVPAAALYGVLLLVTAIQVGTNGFVAFDRVGVTLADRRYERADQEVRLVGMMHIGEQDAYRELVSSFRADETIVLEEGVTDEQQRLASPLAYDGVAGFLGLDTQEDLASYLVDPATDALPEWPVLRHADVDLAAFAPETIAWLAQTHALWSSGSILEALKEMMRTSAEDPEILVAVERDVFTLRNEHLIGEIEAALGEFQRVIVPWGALHLPAIETAILAEGFAPSASQRRRLLSWGTIAGALF